MLALYLLCFGLGASLIAVSLVFGGGDKDFDKDLSVDKDLSFDKDLSVDKDLDVEPDAGVDGPVADAAAPAQTGFGLSHFPFLSMRFWTFALAAFGATGAMLTLLGVWPFVVAAIASAVGGGIGWGTATLFRRLRNEVVTAPTTLGAYRGEEAKVVLPIRAGAMGKVAVQGPEGRVEMFARSSASRTLEPSDAVVIIRVVDGIAEVAPLQSDVDLATDEAPRPRPQPETQRS